MKIFITTLLISILYLSNSYAEDTPKRVIPDGKTVNIDGEEGIFFTLDEYKIIGLVYNDYIKLYDEDKLANYKFSLVTNLERNYDLRLENCEEYISIMEHDRDFWKSRVKENNKTIRSLNRSNIINKTIYLILIGVLSVADLVLVINK